MRYAAFWPQTQKWWNEMKVNPNRKGEFRRLAQYALEHKAQYQEVEKATGVPWYMVAVIHRREADGNFNAYLGNGQSLRRRTTEVPEGRGPFKTFLEGAKDAMHVDGLDSVHDWRLEKMLYYCQKFNGFGYPGPSPYVWGGTNVQRPGKYVRDHVYDAHFWDPQPGCAPLLQTIAELDKEITFVPEK